MKKLLMSVSALVFAASLSFGQVMQEAGVENNLFTGFGSPLYGDPLYYGFIDTLQARVDVNQFTIEGMLNWGALAEWSEDEIYSIPGTPLKYHANEGGHVDSFTFKNTPRSALGYLLGYYDTPDAHYNVNFYATKNPLKNGLAVNSLIDSGVLEASIASSNLPDFKKNEFLKNIDSTKKELIRKLNLDFPVSYLYNGYKNGQTQTDDYYVNFLWHPDKVKGLDVGLGTKLNWQVGPAPRFGSWLWEPDAHVRQGGFSTSYDDRHGSVGEYQFVPDAPGSADVVGFVPYANKYAKKAIGVRYNRKFDNGTTLQVGGAIPDGTNTDHFRSNFGVALGLEHVALAFAYEGLFQRDGNAYAGASFMVKQFAFDVYGAWDGIDFHSDDDMSFSTGVAMTINIEKAGITIRPEGTLNWFENSNYTPAWYTGGLFQWDINEKFSLLAWSSFAVGSKDKRWDDYLAYTYYKVDDTTVLPLEKKHLDTGHIFDIRPEFVFHINERHTLSGYYDYENRVAFDGTSRDCWSTGIYWTYKVGITKASAKAKK